MTVTLLTILISIYFSDYVKSEYNSCPTSNSEVAPVRLRDSLTCQYDPYIGPINTKNTTDIIIGFLPSYFTYDDMTGTINLDVFVSMAWKDPHLTWNPSDYDKIKTISLDINEIWAPDISIYNLANMGYDPTLSSNTKCDISYDGHIHCLPNVHVEAVCVPDLTNYPFDVQNCTLRIGSWVYKGEEMNITMDSKEINLIALVPNGEWEMIAAKSVRNAGIFRMNESFPSIEIFFEIKRLSTSHTATIVVPLIGIMLLTLSSLFIPVLEEDRTTLCLVNIIAHFIQIQFMCYIIPLKGENVPFIIIFSRDSMLLAVFTLILTILFKHIAKIEAIPPAWVMSFINFFMCVFGSCHIGNFNNKKTVLDENAKEEEGTVSNKTTTNNENWLNLVSVLDIILLIIYIIIYFIMCIRFIP